jgi:hypothetical protein
MAAMTAQSHPEHTAPRNVRTGLILIGAFLAMFLGSVVYIVLYH